MLEISERARQSLVRPSVARGSSSQPSGRPAARFAWRARKAIIFEVKRFVLDGAFLLCLAATSCAPSTPPHWAEGGSQLPILPARWDRPDEDSIELQPDGRVVEGGHLRFVLDRVGRVTDGDYEPFAVLLPDGRLVGSNDTALGYVGVNNASPPFAPQAWLSLTADGRVLYFESNGDRSAGGTWRGCDGPGRRACTLVTQIFALKNYRRQPTSGVTFGVGVGIGL
jgi:hypothetical protein